MFKKLLVAAAFAIACPAFIFAQDVNFLFGGNLAEAGGTPATTTDSVMFDPNSVQTGSVNIFAAPGFDFDAADLDFFSSNTAVAQITGGEAFNPTNSIGQIRFDGDPAFTTEADGSGGSLFAVRVLGSGVDTVLSQFDPLFDADDGALVARIDFEIVGPGETVFSLAEGESGFFELPGTPLDPTFGSANLTVTSIPEPSSAILLILGSVAMVARRKRV